ncbi:hypothetical protein mRhiFer1_008935 [Rhinolophus ferrumequinum]|uniref:Uncharacterized protein n=1 Tax=Rhinolophus ferrumequinum TaxID=59479 RepID=A0A7J7TEU6_RHIFE|nr:hypothetical protein mRhiFer1_008935 [Rhinolophus ferrumequinum]
MGPVCPADGVCVRWGWASWPGLQCQDPTLFSVPLLPRIPVCSDPPLPVLLLQKSMKQRCWRGENAKCLTAPGRLHCQLGVAVLLATGSWAEGLALQVNLLTWWLWLAVGEGVPRGALRSSLKSGHKGCNHLEGRAEGAAGWAHGESRATSPAQLHQPPWGAHLWWGKLS